MRFFRWRVWRAVPELDGLDPVQAGAFVRAAKRGHSLVTVRWGLPLAGFLAALFALPFAIVGLACSLGATEHTFTNTIDRAPVMVAGVLLLILLLSLIAAWIVRRVVVLVVIRRALAAGVMSDLLIPTGQSWSLRNSVQRRWRGLAILALIPFLAGVPIAWFEWTLARDASLAEADRTGVGPVNVLWQSLQPKDSSLNDANAWDFFDLAVQRVERVDKGVWKNEDSPRSPSDSALRPEFVGVGCVYQGQGGYFSEADFSAAVRLARELIPKYRAAGVFDSLASMRSAPRRELTILTSPGATMLSALWPRGNQARQLARINRARMVLAEEANDRIEFIDALRAELALAGMNSEYPNVVGKLISNAIDAMAIIEVRMVLGKHPSKEWLDDIEKAFRLDRARPPLRYTYQAEKASELDILAWVYTLKSTIREKRWNAVFGDEKGERKAVGSYQENRAFLSTAFDAMIRNVSIERPDRPLPAVVPQDRFFPSLLLNSLEKAISSCDQIEVERRGLTVMLALERYYVEHHEYPRSLAVISPAFLRSVPIDLWSGRPMGYRLLTAAEQEADRQRRAYFVWSVGGDGVDNGGRFLDKLGTYEAVIATKDYPGYDFIVSDFER